MTVPDSDTTVVVLHRGVVVASWPLAGAGRPDLCVVDELARLQLAARRLGCTVRLRHAGPALSELFALVGLGDVVIDAGLGVEVGGQAEGCEEVGVEEVVMPDDPVA